MLRARRQAAAWFCLWLLLLPAHAAALEMTREQRSPLPFAVNAQLQDMPLRPGSVRIGCPTDFPPYSFLNAEGCLVGVYPDIIAALNMRLNGLLQPVPVSEAEYPTGNILIHWNVDAFMGPADELPVNARFAMPLFRSSAVYLGLEQSGPQHLRKNPLRVIALPHTPELTPVKSQYPNMSFTYRRDLAAAVRAVHDGEAGLIIGDELAARSERHALPPGFVTLGDLGTYYHSIAVRPDLDTLLPVLDSALFTLPPQEREAILNVWRGETKAYSLTPEEKNWLAQKPVVRVAVPTWAPYSGFTERQGFVGMASGYLRALGRLLGITFLPVPVENGRDALKALRQGKADITAVTPVNGKSDPGVLYSRPWLNAPVAIAARSDSGLMRPENLNGKILAVIARSLPEQWFATHHPEIRLLPEANCPEALQALEAGKAQAAVDALDTLTHYIRRDRLEHISVTGFTPFTLELGFAVRAGQPLLAGLLDKGLAALPAETGRRIYLQWSQTVEVPFMDWGLFLCYALAVLLCMLAVVAVFARVNRRLRREVRERQKAEGILHQIFTHMPAALLLCDARLRCIVANRNTAGAFGLDESCLKGKTFTEAARANRLPESAVEKLSLLERTASEAWERGRCMTATHADSRGRRTTHFKIWFMPLFDKHGNPDCLIVLSVDISPAVRLEEELRRQLAFSKGIIDALPLPVFVYDADGRYMLINKTYEAFMHKPDAALIGRSMLDNPMLTPEQRAHYKNVLEFLLKRGGTMQEELSFLPPGEAERTGRICLSTFAVAPEEPLRVAGAIVDITERKQLEKDLRRALREADKASQAKSDFLAHMSHELRTPMNGILGLSDLLLQGDLSERQRDFLEKIHSSARVLVRIIGNILDFSKLEAGTLGLASITFDLGEVMDSVRVALAAECRAKGLDFRIDMEPDAPRRLTGDAARLAQVLLSLAGNAVKFTEQGGVSIHARRAGGEGEEVLLRFTVRDSGMGISPEAAAHVFKPFIQADAGMARRHGGAGLGLSIAQKLVQAMHGEINCESRPGDGSSFYFTARFGLAESPAGEPEPGIRPPAPRPADTQTAEDFLTPAIQGKRILLVEDNPVNQLVARELLTAFGALVDTADNGLSGVEKARSKKYDCILMDIQMPRMDGLTATRLLKDDPAFAEVPIIALTAHALDEDRRKNLEAGMAAHLTKPVDPAELRATLARFLGGGD